MTTVVPLGELFVTFGLSVQGRSSNVSGSLVTLRSGTLQVIASLGIPCYPRGAFYPGYGSLAFAECFAGQNNANNSVLVFNMSSAKVAAIIPVPASYSGYRAMALDSVQSVLYCVDGNSNLTEVNLANKSYVTTLHTANRFGTGWNLDWGSAMWIDVSRGHLFFPSRTSASLLELDTLTGQILATVPMPAWISAVSGDPSTDRLFVSFQNNTDPAVDGTEVLNLSSLAEVQRLPLYSDSPIGVDHSHEEAYFSSNGVVTAADLGSGDPLPSPLSLRVAPVAYDPIRDQLVGMAAGDLAELVVVNVSHAFTSVTPFVDVPVVGASLPWVVGGGSFVVGAACLIVVRSRSARRRWLTPDQV